MDPVLTRALGHPRRVEILSYLTQVMEVTDEQLAEAVGIGPSLAKYHLAVLSNAELIVPIPHVQGIQQSYAASARP